MPMECAGASPRGRTPESVSPPGEAAEKLRSRNQPRGAAPMSMDSVFMQMSACRHIGDRSWKICAAICCGLQLAVERLERLSGGRLAYRMKTPWRDVS